MKSFLSSQGLGGPHKTKYQDGFELLFPDCSFPFSHLPSLPELFLEGDQ
jgi:hypothetical protein